jgi:hypothetical protein
VKEAVAQHLGESESSNAASGQLPPFPENLDWPKDTKSTLERVIAKFAEDPVSAHLQFNSIINRKENENPPTLQQRNWLESAMKAARGKAIERLRQDFKRAIETDDLRLATIVGAVADKVQKELLKQETASVAALTSSVLSAKSVGRPVWKINGATAKFLTDDVTEGSGLNSITVKPREGFVLVHVTATVTNVGSDSDPPYTPWIFSDFKQAIFRSPWGGKKMDLAKPHRLADEEFLFVVTPGGDMFECVYTYLGARVMRSTQIVAKAKDGKAVVTSVGTYVAEGRSFKVNSLFSVPKDTRDLRLYMGGAPPVPVTLKEE